VPETEDTMRTQGEAGRALPILSLFGVAAIGATVVLLVGIQSRLIARQKAEERAAVIHHARQRCDLLKSVLRGRITALVAAHPEASSLLEIGDEVRQELEAFRPFHETGQGIRLLVVDEKLHTVASLDPDAAEGLRKCARHVLDPAENCYVLPRGWETTGQMPSRLCYACPIRRGDVLLGGIVLHKELDPVGVTFSALSRTLTVAVIGTQMVLLVALCAIACSARKAIASAERGRAEDERLAAVGNLAAGVAHEIRNPLNTVALTCRYLERLIGTGEQDPALRAEVHKNLEIVAGELGRLSRTLDDFLLLAKPTDLVVSDCDVERLVDDALALFAREFEDAAVQLVRRRSGSPHVDGDPDRLRQVFANIIRNSIQAMSDGGTLSVTTDQANGEARVAFGDTGPGVAPSQAHRIFEPYFSTKRSGLGLGLALSRKIVEAHGGTIAVARQPEGGALFTVTLPARLPGRGADDAD